MKKKCSLLLVLSLVLLFSPVCAEAASTPDADQRGGNEVFVDETYMGAGNADVKGQLPSVLIGGEKVDQANDAIFSEDNGAASDNAVSSVPGKRKAPASKNYTYKITPLLEPFNQYFFVETDNPDPNSFRFCDKSSKYEENALIENCWDSWDEKAILYSDVKYENEKTGRVNGGYLFRSYSTDGGKVVLQAKSGSGRNASWSDTSEQITLPAMIDSADYLIETYADKDGFFDNMSAVQSGLSSICLYSGSYIRGALTKPNDYWMLAIAGHIDQSFYIYSPYDREDSRSLFASAIYPFRYDSLGFPSMMAEVAERLDSSATAEWNSSAHYLVDVTYNGETHSYGGSGNGKGQGISEDKITKYFAFQSGSSDITLESAKTLLEQYAAVGMPDDIPREDALTWKQIYDAAGTGMWARISGSNTTVNGKWLLGAPVYSFFYQSGDGSNISADEWGVGYSLYWGGDLRYARDAWVDGRYVSEWRDFVPGETFEDHPTSNIILIDEMIPQISYKSSYVYNSSTSKYERVYEITDISMEPKTAAFSYSDGVWTIAFTAFNEGCANNYDIKDFVEKGLIDEKYLDMITITEEEAAALDLDRNTNAVPDKGYIYDGITQPGTEYDEAKGHCWYPGDITTEPTCTDPGEQIIECQVCGAQKTEVVPATGHYLVKTEEKAPSCVVGGHTAYWTCRNCGKYYADEEGKTQIERYSWSIMAEGHKWNEGETVVEATYEQAGTIRYTCEVCGETKEETLKQLTPPDGYSFTSEGAKYKVISAAKGTVMLVKGANKTKYTVPTTVGLGNLTYKVTRIKGNAFAGSKTTTVTISKNVAAIDSKAFNKSKVKTMVVKTKLLKKSKVKGSLKGSKVKTVLVRVGSNAVNKTYVKTYKKIFTKANAGRTVTVK